MLLAGAAVLAFAVVRADLSGPPVAATPAAVPPASPASVASTAPAPNAFDGVWTGALADPDTATVDVRVTVGGPARGTVVEVPALGCTYRGPGPVAAPDDPRHATAEVRAGDGRGPRCADAARIRLGPAAADPAADRVHYEVIGSCEGSVCAPRRASGVLSSRPGS